MAFMAGKRRWYAASGAEALRATEEHFSVAPPRYAIEVFYADLLGAYGYHVNKSPSNSPEVFGSWVEGTADPDAELGRKTVIWVKIKPAGQNFNIEITVQ